MMEGKVSNWNDDRLDELNRRVDEGFAKVDKRFEQVASREEMGEVKVQMNRLNDRIDRLMYTMMATGVGMVGTMLVGVVGLILRG
jgi:hypothetical protein